MKKAALQLTGQTFGNLIVLHRAPVPEGARPKQSYWKCRCECGAEVIKLGWALNRGDAVQCVLRCPAQANRPGYAGRWTPELTSQALRMRREGKTMSYIGQQLGFDRQTVRMRFRRHKAGDVKPIGRTLSVFWVESDLAILRDLWSQGIPTAEIGRRLGVSKNAVIGQAHRRGLPSRPNPIPQGPPRERKPVALIAPRVTLPPLFSSGNFVIPAPVRQPRPEPKVTTVSTTRTCEWLSGPRRHYSRCGAPAICGTSWCPGHADKVWIKKVAA